jgi:predicted permease
VDAEIEEELRAHIEMAVDDGVRAGLSEEEARRAARLRFGNPVTVKERTVGADAALGLESLWRDVKFALRQMKKSPGFTLTAVMTLSLGIGANTTVFSMIDALLLRPLPVPHSEQLSVLGFRSNGPRASYSFPEPLFRGLEHGNYGFSRVFAFSHAAFAVEGRDGMENIPGQYVSGEFFPALGTVPLLGRTLGPEDDRPGGNPAGLAVVISEAFRQRWFGRAPDAVGRSLTIDNHAFTVVGVMPSSFIGADPTERPELYLPLATERILAGKLSMTAAGYHGWWLNVMGRRRPGVTVQQADAAVAAASAAILRDRVPDWVKKQLEARFHFTAGAGSTGFTYLRLMFRDPLLTVMALCGGILLLACLNLASLLTARSAAREQELATRLALGASRRRLVQQLLTESLLIAACGTVVGLALAPLAGQSLSALLLSGHPEVRLSTAPDFRVFAFAALVAVASTLIIGLAPAMQAAQGGLSEQIKSGGQAVRAREHRHWLPRVLLSTEVALALMLVVVAGLLASSLVRLYASGEGFDAHGVWVVGFDLENHEMTPEAARQFYRTMDERVRSLPGVTGASIERITPLTGTEWDQDLATSGKASHDIHLNGVGPEYFRTMRIPRLEGRDFAWADSDDGANKIILNAAAAKLLFPAGHVLGGTVKNIDGPSGPVSYQVVGVVGNAKYDSMRDDPPPTAYRPITQEMGSSLSLVVRLNGPVAPMASAVRALARQMVRGAPAPQFTSMMSVVDDSLSTERLMALLAAFFAVCALLVTSIGLYGTLAYATSRRTGEIGIRIALGAQRGQVVRMVCGQNALVAGLGVAMGTGAALLATRGLASYLYGISANDPWVLACSSAALILIAVVASLIPAWRAAGLDPIQALRSE